MTGASDRDARLLDDLELLPFADGPLFVQRREDLAQMTLLYYAELGVLVYNGELRVVTKADGSGEFHFGPFDLGLCRHKIVFLMQLASKNYGFDVDVESAADAPEYAALRLAIEEYNRKQVPSHSLRVRVEPGVPLYALPPLPWIVSPEAIRDATGKTLFVRAGTAPDARPERARPGNAAPAPLAEPQGEAKPRSVWGRMTQPLGRPGKPEKP